MSLMVRFISKYKFRDLSLTSFLYSIPFNLVMQEEEGYGQIGIIF